MAKNQLIINKAKILGETIVTDLSSIDADDDTYRITTEHLIEPLAASIDVTGLLNPPFLLPKNNRRYIIVSGFRRVAACRRLSKKTIHARLIEHDAPSQYPAEIAIAENALQRPLNLVEVSRSLNLLRRNIQNNREVSRVAHSLGLPTNPVLSQKIERICCLPFSMQNGILEGIISLKTVMELDRFEEMTAIMLSKLFSNLLLSQNKQREIITNVKEIALREGITVATLLREPELQNLLSNQELDRTQKAKQLRNYLKVRRYPNLTLAEKHYRENIKKLSLGESIQLQPPANFESREFVFHLRFKNMPELKSCIKTLQSTINNPSLNKILDS